MLESDSELSALAEARLLHSRHEGYFCVARAKTPHSAGAKPSWSQSFYPISSMEGAVHAARHQADVYISQASFTSRHRLAATSKTISCAFVDLDVYKVDLAPDLDTIEAVVRVATGAGLPAPTYITQSGRGLYAKWVFSEPISSDLLPQWQALQSLLIALYRPMGSDGAVRDVARVLRMTESINSKSGSQVRAVRHTGHLHSFRQLCEAASKMEVPLALGGARQQARVVQHRVRQGELSQVPCDLGALANYSLTREPILLRRGTIESLNWYRFLDLRDLVFARGGIHKGARDITLFWMTSFLAMSGVIDPENFWDEVRRLVLAFPIGRDFDPLNDGSLKSLVDRIKRHSRGERVSFNGHQYTPIYTPSNETLLNMLQISPQEEHGLRTVISAQEKQRRSDLKCPGRAERRQERSLERRAAMTMAEQGVSIKDIAAKVGKSFSTVWRWLQPDPLAGTQVVEQRGRRVTPWRPPPGTVRLTGRGPVPHPALANPAEAMSAAERARRTKTRCAPAHQQPGSRMDARQLAAFMEARKARQDQLRALTQESALKEEANSRAEAARAALQAHVLLTSIRDKTFARARAARPQQQPLGCNPTNRDTGPPAGSGHST